MNMFIFTNELNMFIYEHVQCYASTMRRLEGRVAVVTGAARGIGHGIAQRLAREGCHLALIDLDRDGLASAQAELTKPGRRVSTHLVDVSDERAVRRAADEVSGHHGGCHLLVNNAGVSVAGSFEATSLQDVRWLMGANFWGVVHGCAAFLPILRRQDEGHIVNVSSVFGLLGFAHKTAYAASKFAVRGFSEALRAELADSSIGVSVLYPGPVATELIRRGRASDPAQQEAEAAFVDRRAVPMKRVANALVRAVRSNVSRAVVGVDYRLVDWIARLSPALACYVAALLARRMPF